MGSRFWAAAPASKMAGVMRLNSVVIKMPNASVAANVCEPAPRPLARIFALEATPVGKSNSKVAVERPAGIPYSTNSGVTIPICIVWLSVLMRFWRKLSGSDDTGTMASPSRNSMNKPSQRRYVFSKLKTTCGEPS